MADTAAPLIRNPWFTILTNPRLRLSRRTCAPIGNSVRRRRRLCLSFSELLISSSVKRPRNAARLGGRADNREAVDEAKPRVAALRLPWDRLSFRACQRANRALL